MIVFLTLVYVALLALLVKLGVIKLTLFWKLSPVIWMLFLFVALFIPMQWGAPAGQVVLIQKTVEIFPNVAGEVVEVPAESLEPKEKGDILFRIDPVPFQEEVNRLEAALASAEQNVPQLKAAFDAAAGSLEQGEANQKLAQMNYDRAVSIQKDNPGAVSVLQVDQSRQALAAADGAVSVAEANQQRALLAYQDEFEGENTTVAQLRAQLAAAQFNLDQTTIRAPSDGYVMAMTLRPGQRVVQMPLRTWMAFVETEQNRLIVGIHHNALRHVKIGQKAEVVLNVYPGQTFGATVEAIGTITPEGQLGPSGNVPRAPIGLPRSPYPVYLLLDDADFQLNEIPGGSIGTAAIYTDSARATHIVRRIMMRMESWTNYIIP